MNCLFMGIKKAPRLTGASIVSRLPVDGSDGSLKNFLGCLEPFCGLVLQLAAA
jgi:hypothetical protein